LDGGKVVFLRIYFFKKFKIFKPPIFDFFSGVKFIQSGTVLLKKVHRIFASSFYCVTNIPLHLLKHYLVSLLHNMYPDKKVIVWAHNRHIDRTSPIGNPYKWLGHYISEKFGAKSFHIGLFAKSGETYEWLTKTNKPFINNKADDVENLSTIFPISFLLLSSKRKTYNWMKKNCMVMN
jgi:Erythromycin esterase